MAAAQHRFQPKLCHRAILPCGRLAQCGKLDEARTAARGALALGPTFTIRRFRASASSENPVYLAGRERAIEGMRKAGVPEG